MNNLDFITELRELAKKAFTENDLDLLIGFESLKNNEFEGRPVIIFNEYDVNKLIWNDSLTFNLSVLLRKFKDKKVGIIANGCIGRSIVVLINEGQFKRENLTIIGIPCQGMKDPKTTEMYENCKSCKYPEPPVYDYLISSIKEKKITEDSLGEHVKKIESLSDTDKLEYFKDQMNKCIRCYACRQACPMCYCETCFVDVNSPKWLSKETTSEDNSIWNISRIFHLAGRCVECGACARSCPEGIDLMYLIGKMNRDVKQSFGFEAGLKVGAKSVLETFNPNDPDFFWKGE